MDRLRRHGGLLGILLGAALAASACASGGTGEVGAQDEVAAAQTPPSGASEGTKPDDAKEHAERAPGARPGAGLLSPLATAGYIPLKAIPCSLGVMGSALGFLFTLDARMVRDTFTLNCGGDWVITPGMLEGRAPFRPVGRVETAVGAVPAAPPPPPANAVPPVREPGTE